MNRTSSPVSVHLLIMMLGMVEVGMSMFLKGVNCQDGSSLTVPLTWNPPIKFDFQLRMIGIR